MTVSLVLGFPVTALESICPSAFFLALLSHRSPLLLCSHRTTRALGVEHQPLMQLDQIHPFMVVSSEAAAEGWGPWKWEPLHSKPWVNALSHPALGHQHVPCSSGWWAGQLECRLQTITICIIQSIKPSLSCKVHLNYSFDLNLNLKWVVPNEYLVIIIPHMWFIEGKLYGILSFVYSEALQITAENSWSSYPVIFTFSLHQTLRLPFRFLQKRNVILRLCPVCALLAVVNKQHLFASGLVSASGYRKVTDILFSDHLIC